MNGSWATQHCPCVGTPGWAFSQFLRGWDTDAVCEVLQLVKDTNSRSRSRAPSSSQRGRWPCCDSLPLSATTFASVGASFTSHGIDRIDPRRTTPARNLINDADDGPSGHRERDLSSSAGYSRSHAGVETNGFRTRFGCRSHKSCVSASETEIPKTDEWECDRKRIRYACQNLGGQPIAEWSLGALFQSLAAT